MESFGVLTPPAWARSCQDKSVAFSGAKYRVLVSDLCLKHLGEGHLGRFTKGHPCHNPTLHFEALPFSLYRMVQFPLDKTFIIAAWLEVSSVLCCSAWNKSLAFVMM